MTGYCRFCNLRIEGAAAPVNAEHGGALEAVGLGAVVFGHICREHPSEAEKIGVAIVQVQALAGLYCVTVPEGAAVAPRFDLIAEREKLRAAVAEWIADGLFNFSPVARPAPGAPGVIAGRPS